MKKLRLLLPVILAFVMALTIPFAAACIEPKDNNDGPKTLDSIQVDTTNATTVFFIGDEFKSDGLVVTATFLRENKEPETVTLSDGDYTVDSKNYNKNVEGVYQITVSYALSGVIKTTTYNVEVLIIKEGLFLKYNNQATATFKLNSTTTTANIDLSQLKVYEVDAYGIPKENALAENEYTVEVYKGTEKVSDFSKLTVGTYHIWASKKAVHDTAYTLRSFLNVYVIDPIVSIEFVSGKTSQGMNPSDKMTGSWNYKVTYETGATENLTSKDVVVTDLVTSKKTEEGVATVTYTKFYAPGVEDSKSCTVPYKITAATGPSSVSANISTLIADETLTAGNFTSETKLADGIYVTASSKSPVAIDSNSKSLDGFDFTHRLKLSGRGNETARSIKLEITGPSKITVYMMSSSSADDAVRTVGIYSAIGETADDADSSVLVGEAQMVGGKALEKHEYTVAEEGTYYLAATTGGTNVYYIAVDTEGTPVDPVSANISTLIADETLTAGNFTSETKLADGISVTATDKSPVAIDSNSKSLDGFDFTHRLKLGGRGNETARSIKLEIVGPSKITVYMMSSSSADDAVRTVGIYSAIGETADDPSTLVGEAQTVGGKALEKHEYTVAEEGTYYLAAETGGTNIYYILVEPITEQG